MNWTSGTKYVRRGGGYYIFHDITDDGAAIPTLAAFDDVVEAFVANYKINY